MNARALVSLVLITHNRRAEILRTLALLQRQDEATAICVVDNGSHDGSADAIATAFPSVSLIRLANNAGAAARNDGARAVATPYIAFCDDDCWWAPGALARAVELLERRPRLAVLTARVLVGPDEREDPTSRRMAASPLSAHPSPEGVIPVIGLLAGACIVRRQAFLAVGGYEPRLFLGGEERLLALDLLAAGWQLGYAAGPVVHHWPSSRRDAPGRRRLLLRNALWCAVLRRSWPAAWAEARARLAAADSADRRPAVRAALRGLPWVLAGRRPVPAAVEMQLRQVEGAMP